MKKKNLNKAAKIISGVFLCLAAVFIARASIVTIKQISYFNIKKVITNIAEADKFSYFKGKGIFSLDLKKEAQSIAFSHPDYKAIRIVRILPDKLYIDFIRRAPLARVKLYRPFFVDSGSFLFDMPVDAQPPDLPLITGLDTKIFGPKPGRRYNNVSELSLALSAIKEIKKNRAFLWYRIKEINVTSPLNMDIILAFRKGAQDTSAGLDNGFEVKIGSSNIAEKIAVLGSLLNQISDRLNIKYIDLRFKEPVIKFKDKGK